MAGTSNPEALVPLFKLSKVLNQGPDANIGGVVDQAGRRVSLYGTINDFPSLLILERAPFPTAENYLASVPATLAAIKNLGANDIYSWYLANSSGNGEAHQLADLKINLIHPCTETHLKKYSKQGVRFVTETPEIYANHIKPYMQAKREAGRLNWVFNIIEGVKEAEDVIYRTPLGRDGDEGFLLLPDLNWDRKTVEALHLLCLVERRDIWSLRDLKKKHIPWLQHMRAKLLEATCNKYPDLEPDQLKLYVHYQPTYYHFHIHIVHVALEAGATQATGKAVGLESIMETLNAMDGDDEAGMDRVSMSYMLGEAGELWIQVFESIKNGAKSRA
ncbi:Scavenger mRNA-decapping enzyme [Zalerion maritima]|uniref:Scavenger mRNA-decapping enzyme n=1 Tax=Zalerion maritima TaxID=339359 RepID=A0AAD5S0Z4_9PEZI|nr:Scavenger mRNA-decapping enzyme [Zalerion maritima]